MLVRGVRQGGAGWAVAVKLAAGSAVVVSPSALCRCLQRAVGAVIGG